VFFPFVYNSFYHLMRSQCRGSQLSHPKNGHKNAPGAKTWGNDAEAGKEKENQTPDPRASSLYGRK
jgi:hypothetical protein